MFEEDSSGLWGLRSKVGNIFLIKKGLWYVQASTPEGQALLESYALYAGGFQTRRDARNAVEEALKEESNPRVLSRRESATSSILSE